MPPACAKENGIRSLTSLLAALGFLLPGAAWATDDPCANRRTLDPLYRDADGNLTADAPNNKSKWKSLALAFPLGVLAARNIVASPLVRYGAKLCLVAVFAVVLFAEVAVTAIRKRVL
ncbi:MAG: hypothetical protein Q7W02_11560 [Candidatus Rokubacteria bacterium]|nr:hypothetical protein [Candidatus Rokubacteria bacterium]